MSFFWLPVCNSAHKNQTTKPSPAPDLSRQFSSLLFKLHLLPKCFRLPNCVCRMRNDGTCPSAGRAQFLLALDAACSRKGYPGCLEKSRFPWKAGAGLAVPAAGGREGERLLRLRGPLLLVVLRSSTEMCLCCRKGKLIIFLSSWRVSRKKLFCVESVCCNRRD